MRPSPRPNKKNNVPLTALKKIERWGTLAGLKGLLKNRARNLLAHRQFGKKLWGVGLYSLLTLITTSQIVAVLILTLSLIANITGGTTPLLAAIINPDITVLEKIKLVTGFKVNINQESARGGPEESCYDLEKYWRADLNTNIKKGDINLKDRKLAGSISFKEPVSSFFGLELTFRSYMHSGINTIFALTNSNGTVKYALGDGDFRTIRIIHSGPNNIIRESERVSLPSPINNAREIGFKVNTVEKAEGVLVLSAITYYDNEDNLINLDLKDIYIPDPKRLYINIILGLDASKEAHAKDARLEVLGCSVVQMDPSKLLNI